MKNARRNYYDPCCGEEKQIQTDIAEFLGEVVVPPNSLIENYLEKARLQEESSDTYLLGSFLPVISACIGRKIWFKWGERKIYPNLFMLLVGKPGDRKSSAVNLADSIAKNVLDGKMFLPQNFSFESLADLYFQEDCSDKLLIIDEGNIFFDLLNKATQGERLAGLCLTLYDCKGLSESFMRNKDKSSITSQYMDAKREVKETSTSFILATTYNNCVTGKQNSTQGFQRRFLFFHALRHGREILLPPTIDRQAFDEVRQQLELIKGFKCEDGLSLGTESMQLFKTYQILNRKRLDGDHVDELLSRYNSQPDHALKLSIVYQVSIWAKRGRGENDHEISLEALRYAIATVERCSVSALTLQEGVHRDKIWMDARQGLERLCGAYKDKIKDGLLKLTRTEITKVLAQGKNEQTSNEYVYGVLIQKLRDRKLVTEEHVDKTTYFTFKVEE